MNGEHRSAGHPRIGMTLGDPSGVGPELVVRALASDGSQGVTVFGDRGVLDDTARRLSLPLVDEVIAVSSLRGVVPGVPHAGGGAAQVAFLEAAVAAARRGEVDALVTGPIHKAACKAAGFDFPGHTEFLAERLGAPHVAMMLAGPHLRTVPATIHVALADVPSLLGRDLVATLCLVVRALRREFGLGRPRVAVCGLNPHAGEGGHFGDEEARLIVPAIERARQILRDEIAAERSGITDEEMAATDGKSASTDEEASGFELTGPHVPDAVFRAAATSPFGEGRYDAVVAMYHDQALIPVKLLDFDDAVNVTLGLPIPRTSPDHGVGYEVAGTSLVRDGSFRAALRLARSLALRARRPAGAL